MRMWCGKSENRGPTFDIQPSAALGRASTSLVGTLRVLLNSLMFVEVTF